MAGRENSEAINVVLSARRGWFPNLPKRAWILLGADAFSAVGMGATVPLLFAYLHTGRGVPAGTTALIVAIQPLMALIGNPVGGLLVDRIGSRRATLLGLLAVAGAAVGMANLGGVVSAALTVGCYGLAMAVLWPALNSLLATTVTQQWRGTVFAVRFFAINLGGAVGSGLAALVLARWPTSGFSCMYLLSACTFVVFAVFVQFLSPRSLAGESQGNAIRAGWRAVVRDMTLRRLSVIVAFLMGAGFAQDQVGVVGFATDTAGIGVGSLSWIFTANMLAVVCFQAPVLWLMTGRRRTSGMVAGTCCMIASWVLLLIGGASGIGVFIAAMVVFAAGEVLMAPLLPELVNGLAPESMRGRYNGALALSQTLGTLAGTLIAGAALSAGQGRLLFLGLITVLSSAAWLTWRLERHLPLGVNQPATVRKISSSGLSLQAAP